jgi:hypothetical protein
MGIKFGGAGPGTALIVQPRAELVLVEKKAEEQAIRQLRLELV